MRWWVDLRPGGWAKPYIVRNDRGDVLACYDAWGRPGKIRSWSDIHAAHRAANEANGLAESA